jgi:hypothetical protein
VATTEQVSSCMKRAIQEAEKVLGYETNCRFKVNLIVDKEGKYFGFGYIRVSEPKIYWMLLGRNPDGSERFEEYPDPDWVKPENPYEGLSMEEITEKNKGKSWVELAEEEESLIHLKIKKILPPLITIPGYEYDPDQIEHLKELEDKNMEIPKIGYFEISRAYATDPPSGLMKNRICARRVPDWIPVEAFKMIFSTYVSDKNKKATVKISGKNITDTYPIVNFVESKKGRIVFITFDPKTDDAIFCLLMTKKTRIINPSNPNQKITLIFTHSYDNKR